MSDSLLEMRVPFIIAEAGSCHEETLSNAIKLVTVAAEAGADAIKFQFWSSPERMRERRKVTKSGAYDQGSVRPEWMDYLKKAAHGQGLLFGVSVFLPEDVEFVSTHGDYFKVSSFESRDKELTDAVFIVREGRPFFVSTGMSEGEYAALHSLSNWAGKVIWLHCVSAYPCPLEEANLGAIELHEGYSDHTRCVLTGGFAVAAGADYLEVHFRLNETSQTCPDYVVSLSPQELANYVRGARAAALMRGTGEKRIMESERVNLGHRVMGDY